MKVWGILVLGALILGPTTDAVARPGFFVKAPSESFQFSLPSSNGYRLRVGSTDSAARHRGDFAAVLAQKGMLGSVTYLTRDQDGRADVIDIKLPGVGRIAVRFVPTRSRTQALASNCKGPATIVRKGTFRGTIVFHGERGYTSAQAHMVRGTAREHARRVCRRVRSLSPPIVKDGGGGNSLFAGMDAKRSTVEFTASAPPPLPGMSARVFFGASVFRRHEGFRTIAAAGASGGPSTLSVSGPEEAPTGATVSPPPPFAGSATFGLESPTSANWLGDLSADLPGLGRVALAGTEFWSTLCAGGKPCTKTLPENVGLGIIGFSGRDR